jgi:hypothetical protein
VHAQSAGTPLGRVRDIREALISRTPSRGGLRTGRAARGLPGSSPGGQQRYFLFLRWIRVFFSSLRCFFFAMRLRRFLMTEPMGHHPLVQRQTGRHHPPPYGRLGTRPEFKTRERQRPRSPQAYLLPHGPGTRPGDCPRENRTRRHGRRPHRRQPQRRTGTAQDPRHPRKRGEHKRTAWRWERFRSTAPSGQRALRLCRRRPPAGTG